MTWESLRSRCENYVFFYNHVKRSGEVVYALSELKDLIGQLLRRGFADGFLIIKDKGTGNWIELRKYLFSPENYGLNICFPHLDWSKDQFSLLQKYCDENGIEYQLSKDDHFDRAPEYLFIDCKKDFSEADSIVNMIMSSIFGLPKEHELNIELRNISPWNELIDSSNQKRMPFWRGMKQVSERIHRHSGIPLWEFILTKILGFTQLIGTLGVVYVLAFSGPNWSRIRFDTAGLYIDAPTVGIVFLALVLLGIPRFFTRSYWYPDAREIDLRKNGRWSDNRFLSILKKLFFITLVNPLSLSYSDRNRNIFLAQHLVITFGPLRRRIQFVCAKESY